MERSWGEVARALRQISYHRLAEEIEGIEDTGIILLFYTFFQKDKISVV